MSSEKFLAKFFEKLKKKDFADDEFLTVFYKFYKKSKTITDLFTCYIDYIIRNREFKDANEKNTELLELYDEIRDAILMDDKKVINLGFVSAKERQESSVRHDVESKKNTIVSKSVDGGGKGVDDSDSIVLNQLSYQKEEATKVDKAVMKELKNKERAEQLKGSVKVNKQKSLQVLSDFIKQSTIITYENPDQCETEQDQIYRDLTANNIVYELKALGQNLPVAKKDVEFGQRSVMMDIWRDTEQRCQSMCEKIPGMEAMLSKLFFIDTNGLQSKQKQIKSISMKEVRDVLPGESFLSCYSDVRYQTTVKLTNSHPLDEVTSRGNKSLYICAGSQMVLGGNADQGLNVTESMAYMTSTYSIAISRALYAYSLANGQVLLCPNVLVFKDSKYQLLPKSGWKKIAIMCAPARWRPELINSSIEDLSRVEGINYIYDTKTNFKSKDNHIECAKTLNGCLETALFFGYDSIVIDDRAIADNMAPAHVTATVMRNVINLFNGRFKEIIIAVDREASFNVFRHYF